MRLHGEVAVITGATSGIGEAIARRFSEEGAKVAVVGRNKERGEAVVSAIKSRGGTASFFSVDVTSDKDVKNMVDSVIRHFGTLTIIVNNAGLVVPGTVIDMTPDQWENVFRTNVTSTYLVSHYSMPYLVKQRKGSVINISSEAGLKGFKDRSAYCAAKAAIVGLTKAMAVDHSGSGVRINCICPGTVETPMVQRVIDCHANPVLMREEFLLRRLTPYLGVPEDIAEAALYFALPENRYTTGAILSVDGGALAK
ncbi:SDR family NAD(P)-dependent oxidoreductase [Effusibacillus lacus]|uniref:Short-chain dehydrogenase n=1 Tax=Effusibacillus lacus TaxID=1348429 RepID=A0A292YF93_9BACL|nr:SDR family NAD(P)-dependent oxidoreductase [Effusibacillus lacus]TCS74755.1 NAD(P)-dependent dehydrogenase (short-subunit alcohol dehydrogenase family) [Effusibacillus lacus]GAX88567.1 short-chain dehydrogenase [Effusibacillus lacus]